MSEHLEQTTLKAWRGAKYLSFPNVEKLLYYINQTTPSFESSYEHTNLFVQPGLLKELKQWTNPSFMSISSNNTHGHICRQVINIVHLS